MKRLFYYLNILFFISFFLILSGSSCKKEENPLEPSDTNGIQGKISTGSTVDVLTTSIGSGGGTIKVSKPGTPIDGMEILVPPNSFSTSKTFKISYAEIKNHQFGQYFNPVSPMISVTYEGGYSKDGMSVKIPINLPTGHFAMGFLYDDKTGKIEGMPIESLSNNFITVDTRSFTTASAQLNKRNGINDVTSTGKMIISSISETVLNGQTIISSGFTPGVDDWEFVNYGSYLESDGHCAGQSISAMWYYYEKKLKGAPKLFHRFDKYFIPGINGDDLWMDNRNGFRFASMVQNSIDWAGMIRKIFLKWRENPNYHILSWKAFALSMLITGEPQYVGLEGVAGAHAIIAHKISLTENKLYVTDPNFPGQERVIKFNGNTFDPYSTKQNTKAPVANPYTGIGYFSKTSLVEWATISQLYNDLENGISGNAKFPSYSLFIKKGVNISAFNDGVVLDIDTLNIFNKSTDCLQFLSGTDRLQFISIYDTTGKKLASGDFTNKGIATLKLKPWANKLGLYIMGARNNDAANYVDFKWVIVNYVPSPCPATVSYSGKTYKTVVIGTQCWLKENLDVGVMIKGGGQPPTYLPSENQTNNGLIEKYCYNDDPANCSIYGGLYNWAEAVQYKNGATISTSPNPPFTGNVQGICPSGWHIPSEAEFLILGSSYSENDLKAVGQGTGPGAGTNTSGFSGLLGGSCNAAASNWGGLPFHNLGEFGYFWSSTDKNIGELACTITLSTYSGNRYFLDVDDKGSAISVRCIKD